ncbi:MAG: hypothetical protein LBE13_14330 [Bacteroidales bacterium]|jgi:hypothetical protein|nr:hypothetical protein [Bacteroidales bacterium]
MKILFLCGSLEPGRDGVGDYTRRLAGELIRQGHETAIISLNDRFIDIVVREEQKSEDANIPVLRLSSGLSNKERYSTAENYINCFDPEWLSLQFVPYSFQKKGLPFGLGKRLAKIGKGRKWHIMFHELWVGSTNKISKEAFIHILQRKIIRNGLKKLCPICVHTSLPEFKEKLLKLGVIAYPFPIFSNIPNTSSGQVERDNIFRVTFFSQLGVCDEIVQYLQNLCAKIEDVNKKLAITLISGSIEKASMVKRQLHRILPPSVEIEYTGFLSEKEISQYLSQQDIGITPIPRHALGKSGSVSAFMLHQLPVSAPCVHNQRSQNDWGFFDDDVIQCCKNALDINKITSGSVKINEIIMNKFNVKSTVFQYINDLNYR